MTANISFQIESKENVLRVPTSALRYFPLVQSVHPDDRHYIEGTIVSDDPNEGSRLSAGEKSTLARNRQKRIVWVQEEQFLRAVPIVVGIFDNQYAELVEGNLQDNQALVIGVDPSFGKSAQK
jgi:HlyD family secretion protein